MEGQVLTIMSPLPKINLFLQLFYNIFASTGLTFKSSYYKESCPIGKIGQNFLIPKVCPLNTVVRSFKMKIIFNNKPADFVLITADVLVKKIIILIELRIAQLCS